MTHSLSCHLATGNEWRSCDCMEIDLRDVPCVSCEGVQASAEACTGCVEIRDLRAEAFAAFRALPVRERRRIRDALRAATEAT